MESDHLYSSKTDIRKSILALCKDDLLPKGSYLFPYNDAMAISLVYNLNRTKWYLSKKEYQVRGKISLKGEHTFIFLVQD